MLGVPVEPPEAARARPHEALADRRKAEQAGVERRWRWLRKLLFGDWTRFAAILAARLMPGVPATGLHYAAGVSPVGTRAFAAAMAIGALLRTVPYAILGQGLSSGSIATILIAAGSVALGAVSAGLLVRQIRRSDAALA